MEKPRVPPPFVAFDPIGQHNLSPIWPWVNLCLTTVNFSALALHRFYLIIACPSYALDLTYWIDAGRTALLAALFSYVMTAPSSGGYTFESRQQTIFPNS